MKKALMAIVLLSVFFGCKKSDNPGGVTLVGKWHLIADTVQTYTAGALVKTETGSNTKAGYSDLQFYRTGEFDIYNTETYANKPTYTSSESSLTLSYPASEAGAPARTQNVTIKALTETRLLLYYPPVSTNGQAITFDFVKLN
ncbi:hypothetical protein DYU05_18195 [Mucilaginibacter terrenus]|uniref:Lipocalin-like domain-containing protein n=1 Tax=Mucilaginibacter terrenus TaxID=2482727 RepID=A0A3E2NL95_9SPHI|nr:hypothetical protein [Mucilaginibacter terrenus]RFZ81752.1 hypothetical protein DYU05_18195 [Mucilaginibacter terrenus]